jgi:hypothetical protein
MNHRVVPDSDHVSRYCKPTSCTERQVPTSAAFQLRSTERFLSVNWLEFLGLQSRREEIAEIQRILESKFSRIATAGRIAILNVGQTRKHVTDNTLDRKMLTVLHEPQADDPSHSGIYGLEAGDLFVAELIAEVVVETYPAR